MPPAHSKAIWYCRVCVFVCQGALSALDAFSAQALSTTSNLNNTPGVIYYFVAGLMPALLQNF